MRHKKTILKNGIRLITVPMPGNPTITASISANVGSRYEEEDNNGIAHFLEHLTFKGTEKLSSKDITLELDKLGARYNAYTGDDETCYHARTSKKAFPKAFGILSDMYLNSQIPEDELEKERGVILEEINMYEDNPRSKIYNVFCELLYGNQGPGLPTLGPKENIKKLKREDFINFRDKYYVSGNTTVVIAGDITNKEAKKIVEEKFETIPSGKFIKPKVVIEKQKVPAVKLSYKKSDQTHMALGFRTCSLYHKDVIPLRLLKGVLTAGMSSRLFSIMREELGICYYSSAAASYSYDSGYLVISSGVGNKRTEEAISGILDILKDLRENEVSKKELDKVKNIIINSIMMHMETSSQLANWYGDQEVMKEDILTHAQVIKKVKEITPKDVKKMARKYFTPEKMNLAMVGPHKDEKQFKKLLKI
jgi:predicted Zn-dependent peptidase